MRAKMSDILQLRDAEVRQETYRVCRSLILQSTGSDFFWRIANKSKQSQKTATFAIYCLVCSFCGQLRM